LHAPNPRRLAGLVGIAVSIAVAACSTGARADGQASNDLSIAFVSPAEGATVGIPFDVTLESDVPLGDPSTGNHHAHLYFDTGTDAADYDIVYGTTWTVTRQLAPGSHVITVALANPDHSLAGPTQQIAVQVGPAGSGGSAAPSAPAASPPPVDY
jgi:hypothetical protein